MKKIILSAILVAAIAPTAWADTGVTAASAQVSVQSAAHRFIEREAPDFGGFVKSPCEERLEGDRYVVSCSGVARETAGGDGDVVTDFTCTGQFDQGHDGLFYLRGKVDCR